VRQRASQARGPIRLREGDRRVGEAAGIEQRETSGTALK
jgi:hypothetical protein